MGYRKRVTIVIVMTGRYGRTIAARRPHQQGVLLVGRSAAQRGCFIFWLSLIRRRFQATMRKGGSHASRVLVLVLILVLVILVILLILDDNDTTSRDRTRTAAITMVPSEVWLPTLVAGRRTTAWNRC